MRSIRTLRTLGVLAVAVGTFALTGDEAQAKKAKLGSGKIRIKDYTIFDRAGIPVATKRLTVLWRYSDVDGDRTFTWNGAPEVSDVYRTVCRVEYTFLTDFTPDAAWSGELSSFTWGPFDPVTGTNRATVFRGVHYDDLLPGAPVPGDFVVTQGQDGLPVPGLSATSQLFTDQGNFDPHTGMIPITEPRWGIKYVLSFTAGTPRVIPAGTYMFLDSQLDLRHLATDTCETGWSEEERLTTGGVGGFAQPGPSTADPNSYLIYDGLEQPPLLFAPLGHPCAG